MNNLQDKTSGPTPNPKITKPDRATIGSVALRVSALLILSVLIFREETRLEGQKVRSGEELPANKLSSADYLLMTSISFHDPNDQLVRIVTFTNGVEPAGILDTNVCVQREFLAKLIRKLKRSGVSVIVIDKYFGESTCSSQTKNTDEVIDKYLGVSTCSSQTKSTDDLIQAVAEPGSRVVIGLGTNIIPPTQEMLHGHRPASMTVSPSVKFEGARFGITRLDSDTRRVPLEWRVSVDTMHTPTVMRTLSLVAAEELDPNVTRRWRLASILKSGKAPFSKFIPPTTFIKYSALAVLCGPAATAKTPWLNCNENPDSLSGELQGKIVLIGENSSCDRHQTVLGQMYGVDLQANYIAAILSGDIFVAVGDTVSNALYVTLWFVLVQGIFASVRPLKCAALSCIILWAAIFGASVLMLIVWGRLLTFWFQGLNFGIILLTWAEYHLHRMSVHHKS